MKNGYFDKWFLFISSYLPLYIWLYFSTIDFSRNHNKELDYWQILLHTLLGKNKIFYFLLLIFIVVSIIQIASLIKANGANSEILSKTLQISPESDSLMNYIITYITPFLTLNVNDVKSLIGNLFLFIVIGSIYVGSSATFLNPVLGILGYKVFGVSNFQNAHHIISQMSFDELEKARNNQDEVLQYRIGEGTYLIKKLRSK